MIENFKSYPLFFFYKSFLAITVFVQDLQNQIYAFSTKFLTFFGNSCFFDLEDIDLGSPKLHTVDILSQTTSHKNLVILAFIEAELVGGWQILPPPPPGRVVLNPIPGRGLGKTRNQLKGTLRMGENKKLGPLDGSPTNRTRPLNVNAVKVR